MPDRPAPAVRMIGVRGRRSNSPSVIAEVDGVHVVTWRTSGWACTCSDDACDHVDRVASLLHPSVTREEVDEAPDDRDPDRDDRPATRDAASVPQPSEDVPIDQHRRAAPARPARATQARSSARPGVGRTPEDPGRDPLPPGPPA